MSISILPGRRGPKPRHAGPTGARALPLHSTAMLSLVELLLIFAALGLGAVGVVKTVDRLLDEEALIFSLYLLTPFAA